MNDVLSAVSKPSRYIGGEVNSITKDPSGVGVRVCLVFPDTYEIGMSHLGIQILYHIVNQMEEFSCERAFAPWIDMERALREKGLPLVSIESGTPLDRFDVLGFSLQYELCFTNVLNILDLSKIPFFSSERDGRHPLVIAGGPIAFNPAPIADFFDAIVIGDGEEAIVEICKLVSAFKKSGGKRESLLGTLSTVEGVYVPLLHGEKRPVRKRLVLELDRAPYPTSPIVPYMKTIHDRLNLEIARGCKRGCRFCEAGFIHRPYRERSPQLIKEIAGRSLRKTGYEEFSLLSLSAGDYSAIAPLLQCLVDRFEPKKVAVSFPSLRIESVVGYLAEQVRRVRKTGFTIAPEAGTDRLRRVINKPLDEDVLFEGVENLCSMGWRNIKLYFMIGLPTEREEDLREIVSLSAKLSKLGKACKGPLNASVSVSTFVPKPHTPFQWVRQLPLEEIEDRLHLLREELRQKQVQFKWQDPRMSFLEAIFSQGDRSLTQVIVEAFRLGCRFDGWGDQFRYDLWRLAFEKAGIEMSTRSWSEGSEQRFPWSFVDTGVKQSYLWEEYQRALREETTPPCTADGCSKCGVCQGDMVRLREFSPEAIDSASDYGRRDARIRRQKARLKVRMRFTKTGPLKYLSHLELVHLMHRAAKRADLPLRYSEGFHPMPRIVFARALPVGVESMSEIADMEFEAEVSPAEVRKRLNAVLPEGIRITEAEEVALSSSPSALEATTTYWIRLDPLLSRDEAITRIDKALNKESILVDQVRKGRQRRIDIRPMIARLEVTPPPALQELDPANNETSNDNRWGVELVLLSGFGRTAKPHEVVGAILNIDHSIISKCEVVKIR